MVDLGGVEHTIAETNPEGIAREKIDGLSHSFERARPQIRELLGMDEAATDTFFLGIYGSTVKGKATKNSDVDGYLFYTRKQGDKKSADNFFYLDYDLSQCFDSPAQSLFGYPQGRKPPNPNGKEDIEAHDITGLVERIANNEPLPSGFVGNTIREIAIIFSPVTIGDTHQITLLRNQIIDAIRRRTGKPFDRQKWEHFWDHGVSFTRGRPRDYSQPFEDGQQDGASTWAAVQNEYLQLFEKPLEITL